MPIQLFNGARWATNWQQRRTPGDQRQDHSRRELAKWPSVHPEAIQRRRDNSSRSELSADSQRSDNCPATSTTASAASKVTGPNGPTGPDGPNGLTGPALNAYQGGREKKSECNDPGK
jgi:hypothetical protein